MKSRMRFRGAAKHKAVPFSSIKATASLTVDLIAKKKKSMTLFDHQPEWLRGLMRDYDPVVVQEALSRATSPDKVSEYCEAIRRRKQVERYGAVNY